MKLAEAKRRATAGIVLIAENHIRPEASGARTITRAQGNGIWYTLTNDKGLPSNRKYWLGWPKAAFCVDSGPDSIQLIYEPGRPLLTLTFPTLAEPVVHAKD